jgi:hypothetical protein
MGNFGALSEGLAAVEHGAPPPVVLRVWWAACGAIVAIGSWLALTQTVDHDIAFWINAVERTLAGDVLYRDIYEINPPIAYLITAPAVLAAHAVGIDPSTCFLVFVIALALASTRLAVAAARAVSGDASFAALLALPLLFAYFIPPGSDFGQREHILAMLLVPYFIGALGPGRLPRGVGLAIGFIAGLGIALKPFFLVYLMTGEAIVALRARSLRAILRPELAAAAAALVAAALITLLAFPDYLDFVVPLGLTVYGGYEQRIEPFMLHPVVTGTVIILACTFAMGRGVRNRFAIDLVLTFAAASCAAILVYVLQRKGWRYQALPMKILATTALGVACCGLLGPYLASRARWQMGLAVALAAVAATTFAGVRDSLADEHERDAEIPALVTLVSSLPQPRHALFFSTHLLYAFPVVPYAGATWPYRYYHLMPLPGLYRDFDPVAAGRSFRTPEEMDPTEARFFATVVNDTLRFPPQMILVDRHPQYAPLDSIGFDFIAYFRQDPRFARVMDDFRYVGRVSHHDVYVRRTELAGR